VSDGWQDWRAKKTREAGDVATFAGTWFFPQFLDALASAATQ
jgi:hypothetical protein